MEKILFIGCYREASGWGQAARDWILAMDSVGLDVVCRPVKLNNTKPAVPARILELESRDSSGCDVCIQNVLPHLMDYNGGFKKNIGLYFTETIGIKNTGWPMKLNTMTELWVPDRYTVVKTKENGITVLTKVVPLACDVEKYKKEYEIIDIPGAEDTFKFYFIGELNERKNIRALIKAFHLEFGPNEPVSLILKVGKYGVDAEGVRQEINNICLEVKQKLKLYPNVDNYRPEILITDHLSEYDLMSLHNTCDCFVSASYGESWGLSSFEAMAMENSVICTSVGGPLDYLSEYNNGVLVPGRQEPVYGMNETFQDINTGRETWMSINVFELMEDMRKIYSRKKPHMPNGLEQAERYSYENVGNIIKGLLEAN